MGVTQAVQQLADDLADFGQIKLGLVLQVVIQRAPMHQLHHDVSEILVLAVIVVIVDGRNARMGRPSDGLGLVAETGDRILQLRGVHHRLGNGLDRHLAVNCGVEGLVDDAHPATSEDALDLVLADLFQAVSSVPTFFRGA